MDSSTRRELTALRLAALSLASVGNPSPPDVVRHLLAMQAQDFPGAKWSIGVRSPASTDALVETSLAAGEIVRSWPLRGTLHFVAPEDLKWMLGVSGPHQANRSAKRRRDLEITDGELARAGDVASGLMTGGRVIRRDRLLEAWSNAGIPTTGQRGYHLLWNIAHSGLIVFGPVDGKHPTFALLDEFVSKHRTLDGDEALAELARRYFHGHGPATIKDFAWWASITLSDAKRGLALSVEHLEAREFDGTTYYLSRDLAPVNHSVLALPGFDEYLLGYQDRSAALRSEFANQIAPGGNGIFLPTIVVDGAVLGTWKRTEGAKKVTVDIVPFETLSARTIARFTRQMKRYGEFLGKPVEVQP